MHPACSISIYSSKYKHGFHGMRVCGNPGNTGLLLWMLTRTTNVRLIVPSERSLSCIWRTNYCAQLFQDITEPFLWQLMLICSLKILSRDELAAAESRVRAGGSQYRGDWLPHCCYWPFCEICWRQHNKLWWIVSLKLLPVSAVGAWKSKSKQMAAYLLENAQVWH